MLMCVLGSYVPARQSQLRVAQPDPQRSTRPHQNRRLFCVGDDAQSIAHKLSEDEDLD